MRFLTRNKEPATNTKPRRSSKKAADARTGKRFIPSPIAALKMAIGVTGAGAVLGLGLYVYMADIPARISAWSANTLHEVAQKTGFVLKEVYVVGRSETARDDVIAAVGMRVGEPLLTFDPEAARQRLENLGWVKSAEVRRVLPDTITVRIEEREALAIWQRDGTHVLIDPKGVVIGPQDVHRHRHLKVLVGTDAPDHAADLLALLDTEPELNDRVIAAQRFGQRRWNLRLENGIDVHLPEEGLDGAWRLLAEYQRDHEILSRAVGIIDLRQPDRITVRLTEPGLQEVQGRNNKAEET